MIATQQRDPIWPLSLQQQQVNQRLKLVVAAVDKIAHENIASVSLDAKWSEFFKPIRLNRILCLLPRFNHIEQITIQSHTNAAHCPTDIVDYRRGGKGWSVKRDTFSLKIGRFIVIV